MCDVIDLAIFRAARQSQEIEDFEVLDNDPRAWERQSPLDRVEINATLSGHTLSAILPIVTTAWKASIGDSAVHYLAPTLRRAEEEHRWPPLDTRESPHGLWSLEVVLTRRRAFSVILALQAAGVPPCTSAPSLMQR